MNYTAIGDTVNLAKRLQESGDDNTIILSENTVDLLPSEALRLISIGQQNVKGRSTSVGVYQLDRLYPGQEG